MIRIFFNEDGYYVTGEGIEISRRCSPATTSSGDQIFQTLHHTYKVCFLALNELRDMTNFSDDVMVYNDSRIIDEINGNLMPLDETCEQWLKAINRSVIPSIKAIVFFRKKPSGDVKLSVKNSHESMMQPLGNSKIEEIVDREIHAQQMAAKKRERLLLNRLRKQWFGEQYNG